MKRIFLITILSIAQLALISCGGGKKKAAWWLFLAGGNETAASSSTTETTSSGGEATTTSNDQTGTTDFSFQTTTTIPVAVTVTDSDGPVQGAIVTVQNPANDETLFQAVTDESGNVNGSITVDTTVPTVNVVIDAGGSVVTQPVSTDHLIGIDRDIAYDGNVTIPTSGDTDGDGIPNDRDDYPADATRATKVAIGQSIIAYEDLYPSAGDADFNDYVIKVTNEEDLNASGKIVRIRGSYTHVARGAGYTHKLRITLPGVTGSLSYNNKLYKADGTLESDTTTTPASATAIQILDTSSGTISQSNTSSSQTFAPGKRADIEITLNTPATRAQVGAAPYDLYAFVNNTSKEIHFPRKYTKADGSDQYMDSNGFPWALQVPGTWEWPLESKNIENAYAGFRPWYLSHGETNKDWYLTSNSSLVFNAPGLAGYIGKGYAGYTMLLVTALVGAIGLLAIVLIRRKQAANV
ncbi:MAG: LruC domain-containing protein [Leptospirales bacterium]|nr:LruC domain-containing protein [Leptospirales bacterium]